MFTFDNVSLHTRKKEKKKEAENIYFESKELANPSD